MDEKAKDWRRWLAVTGFILLAGTAEQAQAAAFDTFLSSRGNEQVSSLSIDGATITGSGTLNLDLKNGLSVVGGLPGMDGTGGTIDPTESITIKFAEPSLGLTMTFPIHGSYGDLPASNSGAFEAQGFDKSGSLIATADIVPAPVTLPDNSVIRASDLSSFSAFTNTPVSSVKITPIGGLTGGATLSIDEISFYGNTVPEPSSILIGMAFVAAGVYYRRSRCSDAITS
ncbi:hypothetical protein [Singulisphaera sp. PoT]|uniref:hypothetical protein n=1 Tax=Singulisphaera sp. PoT TaxID=3411797 RepID=UPI003BF569F9